MRNRRYQVTGAEPEPPPRGPAYHVVWGTLAVVGAVVFIVILFGSGPLPA